MAGTSTAREAAELHNFVVWWASGGFSGRRDVRAPDAAAAAQDLRANPSHFGLPHERVTVLQVRRRVVIEPERARG